MTAPTRSGPNGTYGAVLDLIRTTGTVSRTELVDRSGLTSPSITRIVRQLLDDGLIAETGVGDFTGGKRRTMLQLNAAARCAVGVSLDEMGITYVIADLRGQIVAKLASRGAGSKAPEVVTARIAAELDVLLREHGIEPGSVLGIGVATSGLQDHRQGGRRSDRHARDWDHFSLTEVLSEATDFPVLTGNDATCAAIGEFWISHLPAERNFATVYVTSGFGLGLIVAGEVYRGASSNVGEIGHITVDPGGPRCHCGRRGCLEAVAGAAAVVGAAVELGLAKDLKLRSTVRSVQPGGRVAISLRKDFDKITIAAADGQPAAADLIQKSANALASTLVTITNILDLQQFVLAGPGLGSAAQIYLDAAADRLRVESYAREIHPTGVKLSTLGADAAALGATSLVLHSQLSSRRR